MAVLSSRDRRQCCCGRWSCKSISRSLWFVVISGGTGVIRMSTGPAATGPVIALLHSPPVSSRLSSAPLCLYFSYFVHAGVDGRLSVYTLDNADHMLQLWTLHGHPMRSWHVAFVQIDGPTGPFQVPLSLFAILSAYCAVIEERVCSLFDVSCQ